MRCSLYEFLVVRLLFYSKHLSIFVLFMHIVCTLAVEIWVPWTMLSMEHVNQIISRVTQPENICYHLPHIHILTVHD